MTKADYVRIMYHSLIKYMAYQTLPSFSISLVSTTRCNPGFQHLDIKKCIRGKSDSPQSGILMNTTVNLFFQK